jgi:hypothetical protein
MNKEIDEILEEKYQGNEHTKTRKHRLKIAHTTDWNETQDGNNRIW